MQYTRGEQQFSGDKLIRFQPRTPRERFQSSLPHPTARHPGFTLHRSWLARYTTSDGYGVPSETRGPTWLMWLRMAAY